MAVINGVVPEPWGTSVLRLMVVLSITALGGITTPVVLNLPLELIFSALGGKLAGHDISLQRLLQELSGCLASR